MLATTLPAAPDTPTQGVKAKEVTLSGHRVLVLVIPALAPPGWDKWSSWAPTHLESVAQRAAEYALAPRQADA
jgi:hypothetical protein